MALLEIRPRDPAEARFARVTVMLTNADGGQVDGFTDDGVVVKPIAVTTDAVGVLDLDLTPNAEVVPVNTYYTVKIDRRSFLVEKGAGTESLYEALAVAPGPLGSLFGLDDLADVEVSGVSDGASLVWDASSEAWVPRLVLRGFGR